MPDGVPTLGELGRRMNAVEAELDDLRQLVDGHEPWSHRTRLHDIENERDAAELVRQALDAFREAQQRVRLSKWAQLRQWATLAVAIAAIVVAIIGRAHGSP